MVWLLCKSKQGDGFQGWHKDLALGQQITKTIVINLGSQDKEGATEENNLKLATNNSFNENASLEDEYWDVSQECYLNEEYTKPGFSTTTVLGSFFPKDERKLAAIPQEDMKMAADILEDERKPAAIPEEEIKMAADGTVLQPDSLEEQVMTVPATQTSYGAITPKQKEYIPFLPPIAAFGLKIVTWICKYCDSEWPEDFKRCDESKKWKGGKRNAFKKNDKKEPIVTKDKQKNHGRRCKCNLHLQRRRLMFSVSIQLVNHAVN
jgi:hypothetical protein